MENKIDQLMMGWQCGTTDIFVDVKNAVSYYLDKYRMEPTVVHLHPSFMPVVGDKIYNMRVEYFTYVRPSLFYIGILPEGEE